MKFGNLNWRATVTVSSGVQILYETGKLMEVGESGRGQRWVKVGLSSFSRFEVYIKFEMTNSLLEK